MTVGRPSFREAFWVWLKVGCLGFGGPAGQIALLHREVVERRAWIDEERFAHALSFCMLLPGPEAQQLATWLGWRLHGVRGGIAAGLLFVLPGLAVMLGLSALYVAHGRAAWAGPALLGLKAAVVALVLQALLRMGGRAIKGVAGWWAAGLAFAALTFTVLPFPLIILAAGAVGWALGGGVVAAQPPEASARTPWRPALVCLAVWLAPVLLALAVSPGSTLARMGGVFSVLAVVSFGGAYAALAYVGQAASTLGWLAPGQMLDGLGLAETTPGPLVLVLVFVGFVGAYQSAPPEWAWAAALAGGLMAAWTTFAPSFLWIFAGGPFFERLRSRPRPARALALVAAAAVGVIANLAVWFTIHLLFRAGAVHACGPLRAELPDLASANLPAACLTALACGLVFALRAPVLAVVGVVVAAGLALGATGLI
ncbi:chromate transporter [Caulobacter sp. Root487D2Y]|uniref:chromate efflux transporter n=1 Tax=Caulobacter sp. Root487D2Y TaxID=1736547 RepID=UPI0006F90749|nr:chromate efflux transporter [Caulobacter sp. Root487D2Y]KQY34325.1 chromate transporter [Caulobacter sp. Root487D2Y]